MSGQLNMNGDDITLTVNSDVFINDAEWNWDGISGAASTTIINDNGNLEINSDSIETSLDGQMDGDIQINGGRLEANVAGGWTFAGNLSVDSNHSTSVVTGTPIEVADGILIVGAGSFTTQVDTSVTFTNQAATLVSGTIVLGNSGVGHTTVFEGGSSHSGTGLLGFGGDIVVNGATLLDMVGGTIEFDRGGADLSQVMDLNANLVAAADTFGTIGTTQGTGTFTLNINNNATFTVPLQGAQQSWNLGADGIININAAGTLGTSIAGSAVNVEGVVNINGNTRFTAPVHVHAGGVVDLSLAANSLQLAGGSTAEPNTIAGGMIDGNGKLTSTGSTALEGHGTINTDIEFLQNADLRADGGTLVVNGAILSADILGTTSTGHLQLNQALDTANVSVLDLAGGTVAGVGIANNGVARGHGAITVGTFVNNGIVFGSSTLPGQTLSIEATAGVDLDGAGLSGEVQANNGDVTIVSPLTDDFGGAATVGAGRTLAFESGWTLGTNGTLALNGLSTSRATVDSSHTMLRGTVNVTSFGRFAGTTTVRSDATVSIPLASDRLEVDGIAVVQAGAEFAGAGLLSNLVTGQLTLASDVDLGVSLLNNGQLHLDGAATVLTFDQVSTGELLVDLQSSSDYDQLQVDETTTIAGELTVNLLPGFAASMGDAFAILAGAGGVTGEFDTTAAQLPSLGGGLAWQIDYTGTAIVLRVVSGGLPGDFNDDGMINLADYTVWRDHLGAATESALNGNGNNTGGVDTGDYLLWKMHFGAAATAAGASAAARVPEPASLAVVLFSAMLGLASRPLAMLRR